ncbi:hypothetical protein [Noviherbaspirillum massiliense]|uniref:hypothetical protein n=1 Tax=Noviherbaspirillum massiliense TaxID=1465823 RepID=UPI00031C3443|nr:hypothetical protein [Noviherbaspirillum massiliense]
MSIQKLLAMTAAAILPLAAIAQEKQAGWNPADPNSPATQFQYESAFKAYLAADDEGAPPDQGWRAANAALVPQDGQQGSQQGDSAGHAGHGAGMEGSMNAMPSHAHHMMSPAPVQAGAAPAVEREPAGHGHHHH